MKFLFSVICSSSPFLLQLLISIQDWKFTKNLAFFLQLILEDLIQQWIPELCFISCPILLLRYSKRQEEIISNSSLHCAILFSGAISWHSSILFFHFLTQSVWIAPPTPVLLNLGTDNCVKNSPFLQFLKTKIRCWFHCSCDLKFERAAELLQWGFQKNKSHD